jgi:hypothetical protein
MVPHFLQFGSASVLAVLATISNSGEATGLHQIPKILSYFYLFYLNVYF